MIILFLLVGFRYNVGADYNSYLSIFKYSDSIDLHSHLEIGFRFLNVVMQRLNLDPKFFFTFYSFISFLPLYFLKRNYLDKLHHA